MSMPPGSSQILAVGSWLALGCTRWCLARNEGVEPYTLVWGRTRRHWVRDVGAGCMRRRSAQTSVLGRTRWRWALHSGVGLETEVFGSQLSLASLFMV